MPGFSSPARLLILSRSGSSPYLGQSASEHTVVIFHGSFSAEQRSHLPRFKELLSTPALMHFAPHGVCDPFYCIECTARVFPFKTKRHLICNQYVRIKSPTLDHVSVITWWQADDIPSHLEFISQRIPIQLIRLTAFHPLFSASRRQVSSKIRDPTTLRHSCAVVIEMILLFERPGIGEAHKGHAGSCTQEGRARRAVR